MNDDDQPTIFKESIEPGVINREMLVNLVTQQGPKGEAGRLFLKDGIKLDEVTEIRIEFLNILNIDYLWVMHNLVKLKLSNNIIEKIENLDTLIHLKELDLSFNHIQVMENLNHLTSLQILLLYENEISIIEGIDDLQDLMIFSIGNNNIEYLEHVMYLRKFKKLRSLNMAGNPCLEQDGYLDYLVAFVPQLVYFHYKMITAEERQSAVGKHYRAISNLEEKEAKEKAESDVQEAFKANVALLSISYVEYLDGDYMFEQMYAHDKEGKALMMVTDDTQTAYEEYKKTFHSICHDLYELGLKEHTRRTNEIELFNEIVNEGKEPTQSDARLIMDEVLEKKTKIFMDVRELLETITEELESDSLEEKIEKAQQLSDEFTDLISKTWSKLMYKEVVLHEQMEDINEVFKINMTDMVGTFLEAAQGYFSQMRNAEAEYSDNINAIVTIYMNNLRTDESKIPPHILEICGDKEIFNNNLAASHDVHLQIIDTREDRMVSRLKKWLEEYIERQNQEESERHRCQILEISHFLEFQREEFDALQLQHQFNVGTENPDIVAALDG